MQKSTALTNYCSFKLIYTVFAMDFVFKQLCIIVILLLKYLDYVCKSQVLLMFLSYNIIVPGGKMAEQHYCSAKFISTVFAVVSVFRQLCIIVIFLLKIQMMYAKPKCCWCSTLVT